MILRMIFEHNLSRLLVPCLSFIGLIALPFGEANQDQSDSPRKCFRFTMIDSPNAESVDGSESHRFQNEQVWCYENLKHPEGSTFIFNADGPEVRPELSALVEANGTITHASLLAGELSYHKLRSTFNPLPVPRSAPLTNSGAFVREFKAETGMLSTSAQRSLEQLLSVSVPLEDISIRNEGLTSGSARADFKPWKGYWWPYKSGRLHMGESSPLAKYDRYVKARTGQSPGARQWEKENHKYDGTSWQGHCNGWAAASILRAEPKRSRYDSLSGVRFSVSDLKGLWSEKDKCVRLAFFGKRFNGRSGDNLKDIFARDFHNTIRYYIGQLGKPVAIDVMRGSGIMNNVASAYSMSLKKVGPNQYEAMTQLKIHKYDSARSDLPATAPAILQNFRYRLTVDENGEIIGSRWLSKNPDFLWVPLAPHSCFTSNPSVTEEWIQDILAL
jgi:hypothetical protein